LIDTSSKRKPFAHYRLVWAPAISEIIFGNLFSFYSQPKEGPIAINEYLIPGLIKQTNGPGTMPYMSTGTIFSSFEYVCHNLYDPNYNCLILNYDGKPGVVELRIPSYLLKDLPWIRSVEASTKILYPSREHDKILCRAHSELTFLLMTG
jgi:hypothetical protein